MKLPAIPLPSLSPKQFAPVYPVKIKNGDSKVKDGWTVGSSLNTRDEIFANIVRFKRNLRIAFPV